jgi:predicted small integral membrane protein
MLRISKIVLLLLVGLWGLIGGIGNFTQIGTGFDYVAAVLNPQKVVGLASWQRSESTLAWAIIPLSKLVSAGLILFGSWQMWRARRPGADSFNHAKSLALVGCSIAMAMLFGGFIVAAETYFLLWQTELGALALPVAFRYIGCIALIAIFVQQPDL